MTPVVRFLLVSNLAFFVLQMSLSWLTGLFAYIPVLALVRPWTVITYMFLHGSFMHIALNMLGLFFFGPRVEDRIGSKRFAILYFLSGLSGALLSSVFSPSAPIIGASAGVFGVMMAFAHYWPDAPIHLWGIVPVPARVLVIVTTILAISAGFSGSRDGVAHFAHLGGYAGAYAYLRWLDRSKLAFKRHATAATSATTSRLSRWQAIDLNSVHQVNRDEVQRLIEKVRTQGVGSLTGQEQTFLSGFVPPEPPKG